MKLGPRQMALIEALRSGNYAQAKGGLRNENGFCCLGVACDISGLGAWKESGDRFQYFCTVGVLPKKVQDFFAFKTEAGDYSLASTLTNDNDKGASFATIADIIEAKAAEIFREPR